MSSQLIPVEAFECVVFGATGDLALRKLMPALFRRFRDRQIPTHSRIIGASRSDLSDAVFRQLVRSKFEEFFPDEEIDEDAWSSFAALLSYCPLDVALCDDQWSELGKKLEPSSDKVRMFYFALPPALYGCVAKNIVSAGLKTEKTRIVLEKPIGKDLTSAVEINDAVGVSFDEHQVFRIDHYLGKETVQNLLILRFTNSIFEHVWNANAIDHIQISVCESIGVGGRADYYDKSGALRDMVQNHILQLLCLVAMEPPLDLSEDTVRDEKIKVLRALRAFDKEAIEQQTVRGQYRAGVVDSEKTLSYEEELGDRSATETFVSIEAHIDNWRWAGVPFYLRTGKRMSGRRSEIVIQFKDVAHRIVGEDAGRLHPTRLILRLQPDEGMKLALMTKEPGPGGVRLRYVPLNLSYAETFSDRYPDAYERLLMAVVRGDLGLFMRRDEVEAAWAWVDKILDAWQAEGVKTYPYTAGSDGPAQSEMLLARHDREWFNGL